MKKIAILGSTGSIGTNALVVLRECRNEFCVVSLTAHANGRLLMQQAEEFCPEYIALTDENAAAELRAEYPEREIGAGSAALVEACRGADMVLLSVVGIAGLPAFEYCLKNGIAVLLATKEAMVCGGRLARDLIAQGKAPVLPVDSELSAIFQCLQGSAPSSVDKILLTASGGPFRTMDAERIRHATVEQALQHPNWKMGSKITIDSASMANKGLEIMETRWLFDIAPEKIQVVVHPESIVHSMVQFEDHSVMAQLAVPDMKLPISYALHYPQRARDHVRELDLFSVDSLTFERPDEHRFPCLALAAEAVKNDGELQLVFNCADEAAVELFLNRRISFGEIPEIIASAYDRFSGLTIRDFEDIYGADREIRARLKEQYAL